MISTFFGWFWLIANLAVLYLALTRPLNFLVRSFIVGGAILGAAAGLANGLVMTVNGFRMPVESHAVDWRSAPRFLNAPEHLDRLYCRVYRAWDPPPDPWKPDGVHIDVPPPSPPEPPPASGPTVEPPKAKPFRPKLAFLDDRHPFVVCGEHTHLSKGDVMGFLGVALMLPGLVVVFLGLVWRRVFRKTKPAP